MRTFFTSDLHFGCENLVKQTRSEFSTIEEHDAALLDGINRTVDRNDRLVILGDFCKDTPGRYRPKIRCRNIVFICGNHDKEAQIRAVFGKNVWQQKIIKGKRGHKYFLSHYPCAYWPSSHYCSTHLFGHVHDNLEYADRLDIAFPGRRSLDVGVDVARRVLDEYRPFSEDETLDLLPDPKGHEEIWRDIPGYENLYQVSTTGGVRSLPRKEMRRWLQGKTMNPSTDSYGYSVVGLRKDGKSKAHKVHRLVLAAFRGSSKDQALHGRGGKKNNSLANLCYGTQEENWEDRRRDGTDLCKPVRRADGKEYPSQIEAAKENDCLSGAISNVCYGKAKTAGGWGWEFI